MKIKKITQVFERAIYFYIQNFIYFKNKVVNNKLKFRMAVLKQNLKKFITSDKNG